VHQYFRAPEPYPRQCGVRLHKFARGAQLAEVEEWELGLGLGLGLGLALALGLGLGSGSGLGLGLLP